MAENKEFHANLGDKIAATVEDRLNKSSNKIDEMVQKRLKNIMDKIEKESEKTISNSDLGAVLGKAVEKEISKGVQNGVSEGVSQGAAQGVADSMANVEKDLKKAGDQVEKAAKKAAQRTRKATRKAADDIIKNTEANIARAKSGLKQMELQIGGFDGKTKNYKINLNRQVKNENIKGFTEGLKKAQKELGNMGREGRADKISIKSQQAFKTMEFPSLSKGEISSVKAWSDQMKEAVKANDRAGKTLENLAFLTAQCNKQLATYSSMLKDGTDVDFTQALKNTKMLKDTVKSALALDYLKGELEKRGVPKDLLKDMKSSTDFSNILDTVEVSGQEYYKIVIDYVQSYQNQLFAEVESLSSQSQNKKNPEVFGARDLNRIKKKLPGTDKNNSLTKAKTTVQREQQDKKDAINGEIMYNEIAELLKDKEGKIKNSAEALERLRTILSGKSFQKSVDNVADTRTPKVLKEFVANYARFVQTTGKEDEEIQEILDDLLNQTTPRTGKLSKRSLALQDFFEEGKRVSKVLSQQEKWNKERDEILKSLPKAEDSQIQERFVDYIGSTFAYSKEITTQEPELKNSQALITKMRKGKKIVDLALDKNYSEMFKILSDLKNSDNFKGTATFIGDLIQELIIDAKNNNEDVKELEQAKSVLSEIVAEHDKEEKSDKGSAKVNMESLYVNNSDPYQRFLGIKKRRKKNQQQTATKKKKTKDKALPQTEESTETIPLNADTGTGAVIPPSSEIDEAVKDNDKLIDSYEHLATAQDTVTEGQEAINEKQKDVNKGQEVVTKGQEKITKGQENITKGQEAVVEGQESVSKNQEAIAKGQEETNNTQNAVIKGQEEAAKNQEEVSKGQIAVVKNQEEATKNQEEATKNQEEATKNQEEATKNQEEVTKNQEEIAEGQKTIDTAQKDIAKGQEAIVKGSEETANAEKELTAVEEKASEAGKELVSAGQEIIDTGKEIAKVEKEISDSSESAVPPTPEKKGKKKGKKESTSKSSESDTTPPPPSIPPSTPPSSPPPEKSSKKSEIKKGNIEKYIDSDNYWMKRFKQGPGEYIEYISKLNPKTGVWEDDIKNIYDYLQLQKESLATTKEIALAESKINVEQSKQSPDVTVLSRLGDYLTTLKNRKEELDKQAEHLATVDKDFTVKQYTDYLDKEMQPFNDSLQVQENKQIQGIQEKTLDGYKKDLIKYQNLYNKTFEDLNKELGKNDADINYINERSQTLTNLSTKIDEVKKNAESLLKVIGDPSLRTQFYNDVSKQVSYADLSRSGSVVRGKSQVEKHNARLEEQQKKFETARDRAVTTYTERLKRQGNLDPLISSFSEYGEVEKAIKGIQSSSTSDELASAINSTTSALNQLNIQVNDFKKGIREGQGRGFEIFSNMRKEVKDTENTVNDLEKKLKELNYPDYKISGLLSPVKTAIKDVKEADKNKNPSDYQTAFVAMTSSRKQAEKDFENVKKDYKELNKLNNDLSKLYNQLFNNREKQAKETSSELKNNLKLDEKNILNQIKQKQSERQDFGKKGIVDTQANQDNQELWNRREQQLENVKIQEQNKEDLKTYHEMVDALNKLNAAREKYNKAVSSGNKTASELTALKDTADELEKSFNTLYQNPQKIANDVFQKGLINQEEFDNFTKAYQTFTDTANTTNPFKSTDTKEYQGDLKNIIDLMNKYANSLKEVQKYQGIKGDENKLNWSRAESKGYEAELGAELDKFIKTYGDTAAREAYSKSNMANIEGDLLKGAMGNTKTYTDYIDNYLSKIEGSGSIVNGLKTSLLSLREGIESVNNDFQNGAINIEQYFQKMDAIKKNFKPAADDLFKQYDEWGKLENELNEMSGASVTNNKIGRYSAIMQQLREQFYGIYNDQQKNDPEYTKEEAERQRASIKSQIDFLKKNGSSYDRTTNKGTLLESSIGRTFNSNDMASVIREYAEFNNLGKEIGTTFATNGQTVTMSFEKMDGSIIKVKGSLETLADGANGIRIIQTETQGSISFLQQMGSTLSSLGKSFVSYFSGYRLAMMAISQFKEGFATFKDYDASLTTISYTMDLTNKQLNDMGRSAIDMAEEYGTTLSNAMDIYQIYANMQSTPEQISAIAQPTVVLSNLTGADTTTASNQIQGILQQFQMLNEEGTNAAEASMHVVDVLDKISSNVAMDYAKGISVITESVTQAGAVAYDAGMSYEQLAAVSAKVAERTREDGSSIGNAIKTIATRISKVGKMPQYADEVSNEELSNASASLHAVGVEVYNADGSFRELDVILNELQQKWDGLTDAQKANISFNIAATRQTSKFKNILEAWTDSMNLAKEAEESSGNAMINEEKYESSISGLLNKLSAQWGEFWVNFYNSDFTKGVISFFTAIVEGLNNMSNAIGPGLTSIVAFTTAIAGLTKLKSIFSMFKNGGIIKSLLSMGKVGAEVEAAGATEAQHLLASGIITADELETAGFAAGGTFAASFAAALPLIIPAAIATATIGGLAAYGMYKDAEYGRNVEAFNESKKNYETDTADLDNLKSKLADVNSQIEQIQSQGTITLTDEVQLSKLQQQSKELENQIKLKEDLIKADQEQMKKEAKEVLGSQVKDWSTGEKYYRGTNGESPDTLHYQKSGLIKATENNLDLLEKKKANFDKVSAEYEKLLNKEAESSNGEKQLTDSENVRLTQLKKQKEELDELESQVSEDMANLSATKPYATAKQQAKINEMEARFAAKDAVNDTEADLLKLQAKFENSTNTSMQRIKDYILETASSGQEAITMMEQLGISMDSLNLADPNNASRYFQDMIDSAKQAKESVDEVKEAVGNTFDAVKSASESANQGANWDEMGGFLKNAKDLFEKGLVGTDDFQTAAAFISPKNIDPSQFKYASDAYIKAWKESYEKAQRYLDAENPHDSMDNFINDLVGKGAASRKGDDEILFNFKKTSEAAKELNTSVGVVEASLHKLEEYGFELDGIEFSGEQLSQYSENLEGLKTLYESMEESSTKDLLGKKIEGFETEYGKYQEDLSKLSEEQIVKIKFEYDLASLQMEVENAVRDATSKGTTESWAAATTAQLRERALLEKKNDYKEDEDSGYQAVSKRIQDNMAKMQKEKDEGERMLIAQKNAMLTEMQNSFLEYNADGGKLDFSQWFQSDQALKTLDDLSSQYNLTTDELRNMIATAFGEQYKLADSADKAIRDSRKNFGELQRDYRNSKKGLEEAEESSKYDEGAKDYSFATSQRRDLRNRAKEARDNKDWEGAEYYQRQVNSIQQLQEKFQELQNSGADISWTDFLQKDEYQSAINDILKETGVGRDKLEEILGVKLPPVTLEIASDTPDKIKDQLEELQDSGEEATITLDAQMSDGSLATIEATLDENGVVHYTADVGGVEAEVVPVLRQDGTISYEANLPDEVKNLGDGESTTFKATVEVDGENVEKEIQAVNNGGVIELTADVGNIEAISNIEGGTIHYTAVIDQDGDKTPEKPKDQESKQTIKGDASGAKKAAEEATSAIKSIPTSHNTTITASAGGVSGAVSSVKGAIASLPSSKTIAINIKINGSVPKVNSYTGTAFRGGGKNFAKQVTGTAFASGTVDDNDFPTTWKTPVSGTSLVGELGREIVVDTNSNRWYTVGDNGAEFRKIPKNAIIFNNEQTEELLSNGSLSGASYAFGTAYAGGRWPGSSSSGSSSGSSKKSSGSKKKSSGGSGGKSSKGKSSSKKSKDTSDNKKSKLEQYLENIFDWAEYRLKNLSAMADKYSKLAESAQVWSKQIETATQTINGVNVNYTVGGASQLYDQALHTLNEQIAGTQKSIQGYQAFYNKAVKLSGLDSATIQKIQNLTSAGQFDIQVFGGSGKSNGKNSKSSKNKKLTAIENVSKWYQKVLDTQNNIEDLILQRAELAQKKLDAVEDIYNAQASVYENTAKRDQARMEHILNATGISYGYFSSARSSVSSAMDAVNAARETYNQFSEEFNRQVAQGYLVEGTKSYNENLAKRLELETKIYEAINDAQEQVAETFENIAEHYEDLRERNEERLDVNEGNIDITKRNQRGYTSSSLRNLYDERNNLQYNNLQLAAEELYSQQANKQLLISSRPNDLTALKAADEAIEAAQNKWSQALVDYRQYLYDAKDENIDNIEDYFGALEDYFDSVQDAVDAGIDWKNTVGKVVTERDYKDSIDAVGKAVDNAREKYNAMFAELKDQIEKGYITVGSQKWYESLAKINSVQNDVLKAETARKDLYNQISQIRLDNIQAAIDSFTNLNDTLSDFADLLNDMGNKRQVLGKVDEPYLRRQMNISEQTIYGYDRQRTELLKQMSEVEKYSERWNDLNDQLQDANSNIIQAAQNMEEFADAIREVRWDKFNKGIETIDYTKTELSDLVDILNEENFTNKNGTVTLEGLSAIALYGKQIEQNVEEVQAYRTALEKLQEEYDNNVISQDEYTETSREYMDAIRDSTSAIQDLRDAMTDLYFDALEKENDLLQENISKREENLQKTKDYYNYTKTIKNDTKDIKYLQSQIAALNGVNSLSAQGKLSSLRSQLADATEQYNDDKQNHYFDLMSQGYDKMSEDANKALEDIEDAVKRSTEKQTQIIREMLNTAGNEYKNVYQRINQIINENGIVLSNNTQNTINKLRTEKTSISDIGLTYSLITSQMVAESEAITGANGIITTAINELGMVGNKLNDIVTSASGVKTSFSDIGTEIDKIQNSFDKATDSIVTAASTALSQIKNLADEVQAQIDKAQAAANAKIASATKAPATTASSTASSQASASSSSQGTQASQAQATKQSAIAFAVDYIIKNSSKFPAKAINATNDKLIMGVAKLNGNKTIRPNQVADLKNRIKAMLGVNYSSDAIFYEIQSQLKAMINGRKATGMVAYAKGSEHINSKQNAITNESGWEAIYRKSDGAILTPLNVGDKVFTNEMSENLWKLAQGNTLGTEMMSKTASPVINNVETYKPNITVSFENFMTVQGNVDKDVLGDLKDLKNEWMTDFSKHLTKEFGLLGNKRRFS